MSETSVSAGVAVDGAENPLIPPGPGHVDDPQSRVEGIRAGVVNAVSTALSGGVVACVPVPQEAVPARTKRRYAGRCCPGGWRPLAAVVMVVFCSLACGAALGSVVYFATRNFLEQSAVAKGDLVVSAAVAALQNRRSVVERQPVAMASYMDSRQVDWTSSSSGSAFLSDTYFGIWTTWYSPGVPSVALAAPTPRAVLGYAVHVLDLASSSVMNVSQFSPQNDADPVGRCSRFCKRANDTRTFSVRAQLVQWTAASENGSYMYLRGPNGAEAAAKKVTYRASLQNLASFSVDAINFTEEPGLNKTLRQLVPDAATLVNGSLFAGMWNEPQLENAASGLSFSFLRYERQFVVNSVQSVVFEALDLVETWFSLLLKAVPTSDNELLLLASGTGDVLAFSQWRSSGGSSSSSSGGANHPHPWVRSLFAQHGSNIRSVGANEGWRWTTVGDEPFLLLIREVWSLARFRLVIVYAIHERVALNELNAKTAAAVAIATFALFASALGLAAIGFVALRATQTTAEAVAHMTDCFDSFDVDAAETVISAAKRRGDPEIMKQLGRLLGMLRAYRPFLPAFCVTPIHVNNNKYSGSVVSAADPAGQRLSIDRSSRLSTDRGSPSLHHRAGPSASAAAMTSNRMTAIVNPSTAAAMQNGGGQNASSTFVFGLGPPRPARGPSPLLLGPNRHLGPPSASALTPLGGALNEFVSRRFTIVRVDLYPVLLTEESTSIDSFIQTFLSVVSRQVTAHGGVVEQMQPYTVLVSFGHRLALEEHESGALRCAEAMLAELRGLTIASHATCVLDTATWLVGVCGTPEMRSPAIFGASYSTLRPLASLANSVHGERLVVTERCATRLPPTALIPIDRVAPLAGRPPFLLFAVATQHDTDPVPEDELEAYSEAFHAAFDRDVLNARGILLALVGNLLVHAAIAKHARALLNRLSPGGAAGGGAAGGGSGGGSGGGANGGGSGGGAEGAGPGASTGGGGTAASFPGRDDFPGATQALPTTPSSERSQGVVDLVSVEPPVGAEVMDARGATVFPYPQTPASQEGASEGVAAGPAEVRALTTSICDSPSELVSGMLSSIVRSVDGEDGPGAQPIPTVVIDNDEEEWARSAKPLGRSPNAAVFRGISSTGTMAAMKFVPVHSRSFPSERVRSDVKTVQACGHEHVALYYSVVLLPSHCVFIMEYLPGGSLKTAMTSYGGRLPGAFVRRATIECLRALDHLHKRGVVHGNLKPHNVLLAANGVCKLSDFGPVAAATNEALAFADDEAVALALRGTPVYVAPEVAAGEAPTPASDVWSFGIMMVELMTGSLPWPPLANNCGDNIRFDRQFLSVMARTYRSSPVEGSTFPLIQMNVIDGLNDIGVRDAVLQALTTSARMRPSAEQLLRQLFTLE